MEGKPASISYSMLCITLSRTSNVASTSTSSFQNALYVITITNDKNILSIKTHLVF